MLRREQGTDSIFSLNHMSGSVSFGVCFITVKSGFITVGVIR